MNSFPALVGIGISHAAGLGVTDDLSRLALAIVHRGYPALQAAYDLLQNPGDEPDWALREISEAVASQADLNDLAEDLRRATERLRLIARADELLALENTARRYAESPSGALIDLPAAMPDLEAAIDEKRRHERLPSDLGRLRPRELQILELHYGLFGTETRTLQQVGDEFNISRERARQLEQLALRRIRALNESGDRGVRFDDEFLKWQSNLTWEISWMESWVRNRSDLSWPEKHEARKHLTVFERLVRTCPSAPKGWESLDSYWRAWATWGDISLPISGIENHVIELEKDVSLKFVKSFAVVSGMLRNEAIWHVKESKTRAETAAFEAFWVRLLGPEFFYREYWSADNADLVRLPPEVQENDSLLGDFLYETGGIK